MPVHVSSYQKGMDRDSSKNKYQANSYYKIRNMRITSFEELSNGLIQSVKGNILSIEQTDNFYKNDFIIGFRFIRNYLIIWSTDNHEEGGRGTIWRTDLSVLNPIWTKVYEHADMMLSTKYPIFEETIGYYESEDIIKVYWTDNNMMFRNINVSPNASEPSDISMIDILPKVDLVTPIVFNIGNGNIYVGKIQYAFQYYNINGIETVFSQCTPLIHLTKESEKLTGTMTRLYQGTKSLDDAGNPNNSGKSVSLKFTGLDTRYDKIRVISILYRNLDQEPEIHIIGEYDLYEEMIITDFGSNPLGTLTLNAFRTLGNHELYCKTLSQKGNKLEMANIKESFFDIDFDARAYRFGPVVGTVETPITLTYNLLTDLDLPNCTNSLLKFIPATDPIITAMTSYKQGLSGIVKQLTIGYQETVTRTVNSAVGTFYNGYQQLSQSVSFYGHLSELTSATNTELNFTIDTPTVAKNKIQDRMGLYGTVNAVNMQYTEIVATPASTSTGWASDSDNIGTDGWEVEFIWANDFRFDVRIINFEAFARTRLLFPYNRDMLSITDFISTVQVDGEYNSNTLGNNQGFYDSAATGTVFSYDEVNDIAVFYINSSGARYFTNFGGFVDSSRIMFSVNYTYAVPHSYSYITISSTDNVYTPLLFNSDSNWWQFKIESMGNVDYVPCINAFDINNITGISVSITTTFNYLQTGTSDFTISENYIGFNFDPNSVTLTFNNVQSTFQAACGIQSTRNIIDILAIVNSGTITIDGVYNAIGLPNQVWGNAYSEIDPGDITYNDGLDRLTIKVTNPNVGMPYFTNWLSFGDYTKVMLSFQYQYEEVFNYTYTTSNIALNNYIPLDTASIDPAVWLFDIQKVSGGWFTTLDAFGFNKITSIYAEIATTYYHTVANGKMVKVYNSKTNVEQEIKSDIYVNAWPNTNYTIDMGDGLGYVSVPDDHDCINPYNYDYVSGVIDEVATYAQISDINMNPDTGKPNNANMFKFMSNMSTLGGEGPNIKYEFIAHDMVLTKAIDARYDETDTTVIQNLTSYSNYKNPFVELSFLSNKRDEVYRYGIVATNSKGQDSYVKWIGDIKFPTVSERSIATVLAEVSTAKAIGIKFYINTELLITQDVVGIRIVRVERKKEDRTIHSQGILSKMCYDLTNSRLTAYTRAAVKTQTNGFAAHYAFQDNLVQFISPEINYFKDLVPITNIDYIKCVAKLGTLSGRYSYITYDASNPATAENDIISGNPTNEAAYINGADYDTNYWISYSRYLNTTGLIELKSYHILDGTIAGIVEAHGLDDNAINLETVSIPIINRAVDFSVGDDLNHQGPSGTAEILVLDTILDVSELTDPDEMELLLVEYKESGKAASQYGGLTYEARQNNTFIECGPYTTIALVTEQKEIDVYGGDTFIGFHEHIKTMWEADDNDGNNHYDIGNTDRVASFIAFPCESVINLDLVNGVRYSANYLNQLIYALREDIGSWDADVGYYFTQVIPDERVILVQEEVMYQYNSIYSQANIAKLYFMRPNDFKELVHEDTLIKISLEKVAKEDIDSYLKFLTDNEKVLPTHFGPINDLFVFKNYLIVFFDHAFGTIAIDERALLPIQNNSILELGAGNNLQFFDFISNKSGCVHPQSINYCGEGFVWYDAYNGSMGYYNGQSQDIGLTKGMSSPFKQFNELVKSVTGTYHNNQFRGGNIMCYPNNKYKETLCGFIVSTIGQLTSIPIVGATTVELQLSYCPGTYFDAYILIDGVEYIAHSITKSASLDSGSLIINTTDNPSLNPSSFTEDNYFVYFKDLSNVYSFNTLTDSFMNEIDIFPTWMMEFRNDLFDVYGRFNIWKENVGNYGQFYGTYRKGLIEYVINPKESIVCLFNNYEYAMESYNATNENQLYETWDTVSMMNDYQYSSSLGIACLFDSLTGTISNSTLTSHGLLTGDRIMFSGSNIPTELDNETLYYVINPIGSVFQVSESMNGTPIEFINNLSGYYHTFDIPLVTLGSIINNKRRMRIWRIKDPRDMKNYVEGIFKPRLRDTNLRLTFKYMHADNKRILMHDLYTYYSPTRESLANY